MIGLAEEPDALDPTLARTFVGRIIFLHMCEKLYDLNSKLDIVPQLAAALPQISKDKLTYTIKLRTGIKFNDGTALDAAAVKMSLDRHLTLEGLDARERDLADRLGRRAGRTPSIAPSEDAVLAADGAARRPRRDDHVAEAARRPRRQLRDQSRLRRPVHVQGPGRGRPHHARRSRRTTTTRRRCTSTRSCSRSSPTRARGPRTSRG